MDITSYKFDNLVLSPGAGGEKYYYSPFQDYYGGGGGGVQVNGAGPLRDTVNVGEGYGGGGGYHLDDGGNPLQHGLPGVILLEVVAV